MVRLVATGAPSAAGPHASEERGRAAAVVFRKDGPSSRQVGFQLPSSPSINPSEAGVLKANALGDCMVLLQEQQVTVLYMNQTAVERGMNAAGAAAGSMGSSAASPGEAVK